MTQLMDFKVRLCSLLTVRYHCSKDRDGFTNGSCVCAAHMVNTGPHGQMGFTSQEKWCLALQTEIPAALIAALQPRVAALQPTNHLQGGCARYGKISRVLTARAFAMGQVP